MTIQYDLAGGVLRHPRPSGPPFFSFFDTFFLVNFFTETLWRIEFTTHKNKLPDFIVYKELIEKLF